MTAPPTVKTAEKLAGAMGASSGHPPAENPRNTRLRPTFRSLAGPVVDEVILDRSLALARSALRR